MVESNTTSRAPGSGHATTAEPVGSEGPPGLGHVRCGERLDRYIVGRRLGMGGGGVVYAAYDDALDRPVALKVLWSGAWDSESLAREARVAAELRHPNIVTVFDAGRAQGRSFVVMELVDGGSMRRWLTDTKPSPAQIVAALMQAARGLAHAHRVGFVHRDFKIDNVLVARDGRVLVTDFGLVSRVGQRSRGATSGTPPYMAPEQHLGQTVGPAADQFALCVALFRALQGVYPYIGRSPEALLAAKRAEAMSPMVAAGLPRRIDRAIVRGLRARPTDRFVSMHSLIAAIEGRRRRMWIPGATLALGLGAVAVAAPWSWSSPCQDDAAPWSPDDADRVERALHATGASFAGPTSERVDQMLSAYANEWTDRRHQTCEGTPWGRAFERPALEAIDGCLRRSRLRLDALTTVLGQADKPVAEYAVRAAESLPHPAECWRHPRHAGPMDEPTQLELESLLAAAQAHGVAGMFRASAELAERAVAMARDAHAPEVVARAHLLWGRAEVEQAHHERGRQRLEASYYGASEIGDDDTARDAAVDLLWVTVHERPDPDAAARWDRTAQALLERAPPLGEAWARLIHARAEHAFEAGQPDAWVRLHLQALAIRRRRGEPSLALADSLEGAGRAWLHTGYHQRSLPLFAEALEIRRALLGRHHPWLAIAHSNYGIALALCDQQNPAREQMEAGLKILEISLGPDHPRVGRVLSNLGRFSLARGEGAAGRGYLERATRILDAAHGSRHRETIAARSGLSEALRIDGRLEQALAVARRVVVDAEHGAWAPLEMAPLYNGLGVILAEVGEHEAALEALHVALPLVNGGPDPEQQRGRIQYWIARIHRQQGRSAEATRIVDAAWKDVRPGVTKSRLALLRAKLEADRGHPVEALALARIAHDELPSWARADRRRVGEIESWIDRLEQSVASIDPSSGSPSVD